jgi:molybdate transport system regulatory protein
LQKGLHVAVLSIRIDLAPDRRLGPGKIKLLEQVSALGSIAAGGRALGMSYRRAWMLVDELNSIFGGPLVVSRTGGTKGGGAQLTSLGLSVVAQYRAIEKAAASAAQSHVRALDKALVKSKHRKRR